MTVTGSRAVAGLAAAALAAAAAEYLVAPGAQAWAANAGWTLGAAVAVAGTAVAVRRSGAAARNGWLLLLAGCVAWLVGQVFWIVYALTDHPSAPTPADACWLAFAVLAAFGVARLGASARGRAVPWLELLPLAVAASALMAALMWTDVRDSELPLPAVITALAYPVLYVTAAFVMLQSVVTGTLRMTRGDGMVLLLAGLVVNAIAFVWWSPLLVTGTYSSGGEPLDALWTFGMVLVGIGAATARPPAAVQDAEQVSHRRGAVLPSINFAMLSLVQAVLIVREAPAGAELVLCLGIALSGVMLGVRASNLRRQQSALLLQLERREAELSDVNLRLSRESRLDALTGLGNRLRLDEDLAELASHAERHGRSYCLVLCDLDRFKEYNDALGHQAGDQALRQVAQMLAEATRGSDRVYRYGGEELLLILPDQDEEEGAEVAERHRARLEEAALVHPASPFGVVTLSAGVAAAAPDETVRQVLRRADAALYQAKCDGRNRVSVAARGEAEALSAGRR